MSIILVLCAEVLRYLVGLYLCAIQNPTVTSPYRNSVTVTQSALFSQEIFLKLKVAPWETLHGEMCDFVFFFLENCLNIWIFVWFAVWTLLLTESTAVNSPKMCTKEQFQALRESLHQGSNQDIQPEPDLFMHSFRDVLIGWLEQQAGDD